MRKLFLLVRTYFYQSYRPDKSKNKSGIVAMIIGLSVGFLPLLIMLGVAAYGYGGFAANYGILRETLSLLITVSQIAVFIFGLVGLMSNLYLSKTSALTLAMPVKSATVFLSRLIYVYIQQVMASLLFILALLIPFGVGAGVAVGYYFQLIVLLFIVPMLPLLLATLIGIPLMWIVSYFKNKGAFTTIALVVMFASVLALYYYLISQLEQNAGDTSMEDFLAQFVSQFKSLGKTLYPQYLLAGTLLAGSVGVYFGNLFAALSINAVLLGLSVLIAQRVYTRSVSAQQETHKTSIKGDSKYTMQGKTRALLNADLKRIVRDPSVGISCLMGTVIMIVMCLFTVFQSDGLSLEGVVGEQNVGLVMQMGCSVILMSFFEFMCISCNVTACSSFTREASSGVGIFRILPVDVWAICKSKVLLAFGINGVGVLLSSTVMCVLYKIPFFASLCTIVVMLLFMLGATYLQVKCDIKKPRLSWNTFNEGAKNNSASGWSMLIGFLTMILCGGIGVGSIALALIGFTYASTIMYALLIILGIVYVVIVRKDLRHKANEYFSRLEG